MQSSAVVSLSPSFNSYSNSKLAEIAARVVEEFRAEEGSDEFCDELYFERKVVNLESVKNEVEDGDEDEEFEFEFVTKDSELSPISADEIFHNGKIRPVYPVFNRDLLLGNTKFESESKKENGTKTIRLPLSRLFIEERETATTSSSSSSDADELDGVPAETYCVWRPKSVASAATETEGRCKKSSSTGAFSKRWKLKDLLHRSHSEGSKDGFVFVTPSNSGRKRENEEKIKETPGVNRKAKPATPHPPPSPYNRDGMEKRRTYLPYKQDLVGFFSNVNGSV